MRKRTAASTDSHRDETSSRVISFRRNTYFCVVAAGRFFSKRRISPSADIGATNMMPESTGMEMKTFCCSCMAALRVLLSGATMSLDSRLEVGFPMAVMQDKSD